MLQGSKLETTLEPETNQLVRCGCTGIMELWPAKVSSAFEQEEASN